MSDDALNLFNVRRGRLKTHFCRAEVYNKALPSIVKMLDCPSGSRLSHLANIRMVTEHRQHRSYPVRELGMLVYVQERHGIVFAHRIHNQSAGPEMEIGRVETSEWLFVPDTQGEDRISIRLARDPNHSTGVFQAYVAALLKAQNE